MYIKQYGEYAYWCQGVKGLVVNPLCVGRLHRVRFHSSDSKIVIRVCCKRRPSNPLADWNDSFCYHLPMYCWVGFDGQFYSFRKAELREILFARSSVSLWLERPWNQSCRRWTVVVKGAQPVVNLGFRKIGMLTTLIPCITEGELKPVFQTKLQITVCAREKAFPISFLKNFQLSRL